MLLFSYLSGGEALYSSDKMIVHRLSADIPHVNIYPIADAHIGSAEFDENLFKTWLNVVLSDSLGYVVMAGDMLNNGIKSSKTNVYEEVMRPRDQKEYLYESLRPIAEAGKILCANGGNHCYRNVREVDNDPLYDVMCWWRIGHLYRQDACYMKLSLGKTIKNHSKPVVYGVVTVHGATQNKHDKWAAGVDGADVIISGHTHTPDYKPRSKIKLDLRNDKVILAPYRQVVCPPFTKYGGYAQRAEYQPFACTEIQRLKLYGSRKRIAFTAEEV